MQTMQIEHFEDWRNKARRLVTQDVAPHQVHLSDGKTQELLFGAVDESEAQSKQPPKVAFRVPKEFIQRSETVACHSQSNRWDLLYRLLWRIVNQQPNLLQIETDDDVLLFSRLEKQVRRDCHKMKAFVRFRKTVKDGVEHFIAWHQPDHRIVRRVAPFFSRRFKAMNWTILTPWESVVWDQSRLSYGGGVPRSQAPNFDELEELWKTYYANIFNPARVKIKMMKSEMPVRHWATLPEAELIDQLIASAPSRVEQMIQSHEGIAETAASVIQSAEAPASLPQLKLLAESCTACPLHHDATQTVFGTGNPKAKLVLIGEQPGDQEDLAGTPFIGPAGQVLNGVLEAVGIQREDIYLTNVVKHFKHTLIPTSGRKDDVNQADDVTGRIPKRRLHQRPNAREIRCCRPWLEAELEMVRPEVMVCLGSTAAKAMINPGFRLNDQRGTIFSTSYCPNTIATFHPSAALRAATPERRQEIIDSMTRDLQLALSICHPS